MPRILVIDDRQDNLLAIEALLAHLIPDCDILTALSGMDGIQLAQKYSPDTILLDIQMPVMNGYEVCSRLKADCKTKDIPIIMVTAIETDTQSRIKGLEIGGDAFIAKPIDEEELAAQVNVMLRIRKSRGQLEAAKEDLEERELERTKALRDSEEKLRLLFEGTHDLIALTDNRAKAIWVNPAWEKIFGAESKKKKDHFSLIHPSDVNKVTRAWERMVRGEGEIKNLEYRILSIRGYYTSLELTVHHATLGDEHLYYLIAHDITDRKEATEALKRSEERHRSLMDVMTSVVWSTDSNGRMVSPQVSWEKYTGMGWKSHRDWGWLQAFLPAERKLFRENWGVALESGSLFEMETQAWCEQAKEYHHVVVRAVAISNPDGEVRECVGTVTDIHHQKLAEVERKNLEDQLSQAQKMEAIGTLAGGIAHDFNNILGIILGYTELTLEDIPSNTIPHDNMKQVLAAANRASELVKQILAFSRKSEKDKRPVYVSQIIDEALKMLRSTLPSTIEIRSKFKHKSALVMANPTQVHQVIMNLCTNASHAMRENGGILEIRLDEMELSPVFLKQRELSPGRYMRLTVTDTGHGMKPEVMARIFEPYFTTKKLGEGTGMGLSVVHGIIKSHGGDILVNSKFAEGTTFHIYLPLSRGAVQLMERSGIPSNGGSEHILYVDDEKDLVEMGKQMLEKLGYQVTVRTSSVEVLEAFRQDPSKYDLVITDQTMPNMTGTQLTRELLNIRPDIPIILCTGFSETVNKENFKALGIRSFLLKPIIKKEMAKVIREALSSSVSESGKD